MQNKSHKHTSWISFLLILFITLFSSEGAYALKGNINSHDPSALQKDAAGNFWQYTTGDGIYTASSPDLITWAGKNPVFPRGTWPAWINNYVPDFSGHFWAPDIIYMNGQYYLYYSCSSFGSSRSVIGLATNPTLDQNSPDYKWTDQGMVVYSDSNDDINAIDAGLFMDSDGRAYLTYGSWFGGIGVIEIDPVSGKVKSGASLHKIAGGGHTDWEAPYLIKEGSYYYIFINRGSCCNGVNSTYYIQMGRSTSPTGPFVDKNGVDLNNNGGTTVLAKSGRYIGPGHFGLLRENGTNYVSIHYYDGQDNGNAKLNILTMGITNDWPYLTRDWVPAGQYTITNNNSGLNWEAWGCTGASGEAIAQATPEAKDCQLWNFSPLGDGVYKITSQVGGRAVDLDRCRRNGKIQLWDWLDNNCQKYKIEKASDGTNVFTPLSGSQVILVPKSSKQTGTQLVVGDYTGGNNQKWSITPSSLTSSTTAKNVMEPELKLKESVIIYPNPFAANRGFYIEINDLEKEEQIQINIFNSQGQKFYATSYKNASTFSVNTSDAAMKPGFYIIQITRKNKTIGKQLVVQ